MLTLPLLGVSAGATTTQVVDVGSTIDLGWAGATASGNPFGVSGRWAVGAADTEDGTQAFASDLSTSPPTIIELGTLGGSYSAATDVSGDWAAGGSNTAGGNQHAFATLLGSGTPELIDLNPAGMVWSGVSDLDGSVAVGEVDSASNWWGAAWVVDGATPADPPQPILLAPLGSDPYAFAVRVSGDWVSGKSQDATTSYTQRDVVWSLAGASTDTPVAAVEVPGLPGETATVNDLSGHWAVGTSTSDVGDTAVVWDLDQSPLSAVALPATGDESDAIAVDGDTVVGFESFADPQSSHPVAWDLSTATPTLTVLPTFASPEFGTAVDVDGDWVVGSARYGAPDFLTRAFAYNLATEGPLLDLGCLIDVSEGVGVSGTWAIGRSAGPNDTTHPVAWNLLAPARPALAAPTVGEGAVTLTWTAPDYPSGLSIDGYTVAYRASGAASWTTAYPTPETATTMTVEPLANGTMYEFKVLARTTIGNSGYSAIRTATPATVPAAPGAPVPTRGKTGVSLAWTDNGTGGATITNHQVKVYSYTKATKRNPALYTLLDTITTGSTSSTYTVTGLTNGRTYVFTVAAGNSVGFGAFSPYSTAAKG